MVPPIAEVEVAVDRVEEQGAPVMPEGLAALVDQDQLRIGVGDLGAVEGDKGVRNRWKGIRGSGTVEGDKGSGTVDLVCPLLRPTERAKINPRGVGRTGRNIDSPVRIPRFVVIG